VKNQRLLVCTDLDRTLIPNGAQPESHRARELFSRCIEDESITLAYVTGRHRKLVEQARVLYKLPTPRFVIADVGSTVYEIIDNQWLHWHDWEQEISGDWNGRTQKDLKNMFMDLKPLRLQEVSKQNIHKLSYYFSLHADIQSLQIQMLERLDKEGIRASLVWSVDEPASIGLLDVVPACATKRHAIEFLMKRNGFDHGNTLFAGDSGNDLPVLISEIPSVLVANASDKVRSYALSAVAHARLEKTLYLAHGGFLGMNGNYSAGILEGLNHFYPWSVRHIIGEHND
jgi:HAD superfamily hydrolase (TIGR01484 family)